VAPGRRFVGDSTTKFDKKTPGRRRDVPATARRERTLENVEYHHPDAGGAHRRTSVVALSGVVGIGRAITLGMAAAGATVVPGRIQPGDASPTRPAISRVDAVLDVTTTT